VKTNVLIVPDLLEVATEPNRRALLRLLAEGEKTVTELSGHFPVSRSAISQHLLLLSEVGLVTARKDGRNRYYRLDGAGMVRLREQFESFWTTELDLLVADAGRLRPQSSQGNI
jgi:DNA-binding transcriptional ArsR family regulator